MLLTKKMPVPFIPFATENIAFYGQYIPEFTNYLTVLGSGDQALYGVLKRAKRITLFDKNPLCKYLFVLKIMAIYCLKDRNDFINFMLNLDFNFSMIINELPTNYKRFWECLNEIYFEEDLLNLFFYNFPTSVSYLDYIKNGFFGYLDNDLEYEKLRRQLKNVHWEFIEEDLFKVPAKVNSQKFEAINLSNIYDWHCESESLQKVKNNSLEFQKFLETMAKELLSDNGHIIAAYRYGFNDFLYKMCQKKILKNAPFDNSSDSLNLLDIILDKPYTSFSAAFTMLVDQNKNQDLYYTNNATGFAKRNGFIESDAVLIYKKQP